MLAAFAACQHRPHIVRTGSGGPMPGMRTVAYCIKLHIAPTCWRAVADEGAVMLDHGSS